MDLSPKHINLFFFFAIFNGFSFLRAQSITPFTFNNGGGSDISMEWSMGESVSISNFSTTGLFLNTGVLQPLTSIVTSIFENNSSFFTNELSIGPNPTKSSIHISARFKQIGNISIQVLDVKSNILQIHRSEGIVADLDKELALDNYPDGIYYICVYFKHINGKIQTGIYKIIKI